MRTEEVKGKEKSENGVGGKEWRLNGEEERGRGGGRKRGSMLWMSLNEEKSFYI